MGLTLNTKKEEIYLFIVFDSKLWHNASQTATSINRTRDPRARCYFLTFHSSDTSLEDQGGSGRPSATENIRSNKTHIKVSEKCFSLWVSVFQQYLTISGELARRRNLINRLHMNSMAVKEF